MSCRADGLADLRPANREERRQTLTTVYQHLSATATAYQSIVISLNVMLITSMVFLTGYLLPASAQHPGAMRIVFASVPMLLGGLGIFVTLVVRRHYYAIAAVIRRIDDVHGVFEPGLYLPGEPLYPDRWRAFASGRWRDIIFDIFVPAQSVIALVCAALTATR